MDFSQALEGIGSRSVMRIQQGTHGFFQGMNLVQDQLVVLFHRVTSDTGPMAVGAMPRHVAQSSRTPKKMLLGTFKMSFGTPTPTIRAP
jgi:hypothetical protein